MATFYYSESTEKLIQKLLKKAESFIRSRQRVREKEQEYQSPDLKELSNEYEALKKIVAE